MLDFINKHIFLFSWLTSFVYIAMLLLLFLLGISSQIGEGWIVYQSELISWLFASNLIAFSISLLMAIIFSILGAVTSVDKKLFSKIFLMFNMLALILTFSTFTFKAFIPSYRTTYLNNMYYKIPSKCIFETFTISYNSIPLALKYCPRKTNFSCRNAWRSIFSSQDSFAIKASLSLEPIARSLSYLTYYLDNKINVPRNGDTILDNKNIMKNMLSIAENRIFSAYKLQNKNKYLIINRKNEILLFAECYLTHCRINIKTPEGTLMYNNFDSNKFNYKVWREHANQILALISSWKG